MRIKNQTGLAFLFGSVALTFLIAQENLPAPGIYKVVAEESRIEIHVGTAGVLGFMGHGHTMRPEVFSGELQLKPQAAAPASVHITIDAASLRETAEFKPEEKATIEKQLHGDVLQTKTYPEISFRSTGVKFSVSPGHVYDAQIEGELAMHGITRKITIPTRVTDAGNQLRATGKFEVNRKDYNIETKDAGGGTVKVDKTLEVSFELVLRPQ